MEIRTALLEILAEVDQLIEENDAARALERRIVSDRPRSTRQPSRGYRGISRQGLRRYSYGAIPKPLPTREAEEK
jgi:hypothetical protein